MCGFTFLHMYIICDDSHHKRRSPKGNTFHSAKNLKERHFLPTLLKIQAIKVNVITFLKNKQVTEPTI